MNLKAKFDCQLLKVCDAGARNLQGFKYYSVQRTK